MVLTVPLTRTLLGPLGLGPTPVVGVLTPVEGEGTVEVVVTPHVACTETTGPGVGSPVRVGAPGPTVALRLVPSGVVSPSPSVW